MYSHLLFFFSPVFEGSRAERPSGRIGKVDSRDDHHLGGEAAQNGGGCTGKTQL